MKKIIATLFAAALAVSGSLYAQGLNDSVTVHFSSPVIIGMRTLPAGECSIRIIRGSTNSILLSARAETGAISNVLVTRLYEDASETHGSANVVLERHNDGLHLERIWLPDGTGLQVIE